MDAAEQINQGMQGMTSVGSGWGWGRVEVAVVLWTNGVLILGLAV